MPIFIPVFLILFVAVPLLLTRMAGDMMGIRRWSSPWVVLLIVITALNWEMWQVPREPAHHSVVAVSVPRLTP